MSGSRGDGRRSAVRTEVCLTGADDGDLRLLYFRNMAAAGGSILLEDSLDLHSVIKHCEFVAGDGHAAADDLPLLEVIAAVRDRG